MNRSFWNGRRVLLTGHTGFKGAWAAVLLADMGAEVTAFSLPPETDPSLWRQIEGSLPVKSQVVDLRDSAAVAAICKTTRPQLVLHMAAQAQVREGYRNPAQTFFTNIMGTVNLLEALRTMSGIDAILVVTSDKVYANDESGVNFSEDDALGGADPYSASKGAAEIVVRSYSESFFAPRGIPLATARGGNVVGGGDFSSDRLVPDLYRAAVAQEPVELRYPSATRPWQHVLDCLSGYLRYVEYLTERREATPHALNFGPLAGESVTVSQIAEEISRRLGNIHPWRQAAGEFPPEKRELRLNSSLAVQTLGWRPRLDMAETIAWTAQWYADFASGQDALALMRAQIAAYQA